MISNKISSLLPSVVTLTLSRWYGGLFFQLFELDTISCSNDVENAGCSPLHAQSGKKVYGELTANAVLPTLSRGVSLLRSARHLSRSRIVEYF